MSEPKPKRMVSRSVAIALGIICIVLIASLVGGLGYFILAVDDKDNTISSLNAQISSKDSQISQQNSNLTNLQNQINQLQAWLDANETLLNQMETWLADNITYYNSQISSLNSQIVDLQNQLNALSGNAVTLTFWLPFAGESGEDEFWGNATQAFYNSTGVTVQVSEYSGDNYFTKLATALGNGAPPDFFVTYGGADGTTFVTDNSVADLSALYNTTWAEAQIPAAAKASETANGTQWAIPYELDSDWLYINTALFNEYNISIPSMSTGWTWDQFQAACDTFKANGIYPVAMSGANTWALTFPEEYIFERLNGPTAFAEALARETNFTNFYNATDTAIQQWVNDNDFQPSWQTADYAADALPLFQNAQAAMWIQGTWGVGMTYNTPNFTLGAVPWPYYTSNPSANGYIFGEYTSFAVANATKHLSQAENFLAFISQPYWLSEYVNLTENPVAQVQTTYAAAYPPALQAVETAISNAEANGQPLLIRPDTLAPDALAYACDTQNLLVFTGQTTPWTAATTIEATAVDVLGPVKG